MRRTAGALAALALGALLLLPAGAAAAEFTVNSSADPGDGVCDATCTLRDAIEEANGNGEEDAITFAETLAGETILLTSGQLTITNDIADPDLTIDGDLDDDGTPHITVDAQGNSRVFAIQTDANATLEGLVITGGNADVGGGIFNNEGTLTITDSTISGNSAGDGDGGGIWSAGAVTITNSTISGNRALDGDGGGIFSVEAVIVTNSTISDNSAENGGGGIGFVGGGTIVKSTIVAGNTPEIAIPSATSPRWGSTSTATGRANSMSR